MITSIINNRIYILDLVTNHLHTLCHVSLTALFYRREELRLSKLGNSSRVPELRAKESSIRAEI